jgi:hypothetical protein
MRRLLALIVGLWAFFAAFAVLLVYTERQPIIQYEYLRIGDRRIDLRSNTWKPLTAKAALPRNAPSGAWVAAPDQSIGIYIAKTADTAPALVVR